MQPGLLFRALLPLRRRRGELGKVALGVADQIQESAVEPLPALLAASVMLGAAVIFGLDGIMHSNAVAPHLNSVISFLITRELMPLLASLILAVRSGAAVAVAIRLESERWRQRATGRLGAIDLLPRALGLVLSAMATTVCMTGAALVGGSVSLEILGQIPAGVRLETLIEAVSPADVALALAKTALAGLVIAVVSGVHGLRASRESGSPDDIASRAGNSALQGALGCLALLAAISLAPLAGAP